MQEQICESVTNTPDMLGSDLAFPSCLQEDQFPQEGLQEWVPLFSSLDDNHHAEIVTQHGDFFYQRGIFSRSSKPESGSAFPAH